MMMLGSRCGAWSGKSLPYDAEVEYIESVYQEYIDTGIVLQKNDEVIIDVDIPDVLGAWQTACGVYNPTFRITSRATSTQPRIWYTEGFSQPTTMLGRNEWHGTVASSSIVTTITLNVQHNPSRPVPSVNDGFGCQIKYYSFRVVRNGVTIIALIPVRVGTEGCMYDRVSGRLFRNAGTGAFVVGPDK